jgi:hypothetical protein
LSNLLIHEALIEPIMSSRNLPIKIGVDFDNTIVNYDDVIFDLALKRDLIPANMQKNKKAIRDHIRQTANGEEEWIRLQAAVYGPCMDKAQIMEGVQSFFHLCQQHRVKTYIISHKTQYAKEDQTNTDLRLAALDWMTNRSFFEAAGLGLSRQNVFFTGTRQEKINAIRRLECTHFIDDLEEVFLDHSFPAGVQKILYNPLFQDSPSLGVMITHNWAEITAILFP